MLKILKYVLIIIAIILITLSYYLNDVKKYAIKTAITRFSSNEEYLTTPYILSAKNGMVTVENLNIKIKNTTVNLPKIDIYIPFSYLYNNAIEISLPNFEVKFNNGDNNVTLIGTAELKCWNSGEINIKLGSTDLLLENQKILNFNSDQNSINNNNIINVTNYIDPSSKGRIEFNIKKFSNFLITDLKIPYGGGIVSAEPFEIDLANPTLNKLSLTANDIKIDSLIKANDFNIDGKISGKITLDPMQMKLLTMSLQTQNKGTFSYKSAKLKNFLDGENLGFLESALNNFEYTTIKIESVSSQGAKDNIKISLYGTDQKVYHGTPINLNLNLNLDLKSIIESYMIVNR